MKVRVASAGTGKTTSLVLRYLELIASGTPLRRIAGVTFTRKAADELRQRVGAALYELLEHGSYLGGLATLTEEERPAFEEARRELDGATLTTIHGFLIEALRLVAPLLSLDPDFTVLGEWEATALFEEELKTVLFLAAEPGHGLNPARTLLGPEAEILLQLFSQRSLTERFAAAADPRNQALLKLWEAAYARFTVRLGAALLPPSEVERRALMMVRSPKLLARLASRYRLVLVDEFQDVNPLQGQVFEQLEAGGLAVEVVGDPKQSIYGFRNADVEVFRRALKRGVVLPPLQQTRRHARVLTRFLNRLTETLAAGRLGFGPDEAPEVSPAGPQADKQGRLELHWVVGEAGIADLRQHEARLLAERLRALHREHGYDFNDMAVLARSYDGLRVLEEALLAAGLPYVLIQGRGYYDRLELRDLYHALRVGIDPQGVSLGAWLRSPFAQLSLAEADAVLAADEPLEQLKAHPAVYRRYEAIKAQVAGVPLEALKFLIREPFIDGKRYVEFLDSRARENVDALLFTVAEQPPGDLAILLDRLELLARQADAGDVPQSGEGVKLLTVHRAKGLEWPVVGVFDLGRTTYHPPQSVILTPDDGHLHHKSSDGFAAAREAIEARAEQEGYRLFYVAASRPRDVLVMTGSVKNGKPGGWAKVLAAMELGPDAKPYDRPDFVLQTHPYQPVAAVSSQPLTDNQLTPAPYIDDAFKPHPYPPVFSPSRFKEAIHEPLPISDPDEGEALPGRAATVGTLVHYAISQGWRAEDPVHIENLRAQEVMFPFAYDEQQELLQEVKELLTNYQSLLGTKLPLVAARDEDYPELPMALPQGTTVWQGIIDRLYRVGEQWTLEDYKTDQEVSPEQYHFQLAVYLQAIQAVRGVTPQVQLVFLRHKEVIRVPEEVLGRALLALDKKGRT